MSIVSFYVDLWKSSFLSLFHFCPDDNWSILSKHHPDFKSAQEAVFPERKLLFWLTFKQLTRTANIPHHLHRCRSHLIPIPLPSWFKKKPSYKKKLRAPYLKSFHEFLKWVQMFNIAYSKKHWHTILPEQSPPLYPAGHWQVPLLVSQVPPFRHCGWHTISVWTTMCGSDDKFKLQNLLSTINRSL